MEAELPGEDEEEEEEEIEFKDLDEKYTAILENLEKHTKTSENNLKACKKEFDDYVEEFSEFKDLEPVRKAEKVIEGYTHLNIDMAEKEKYLIRIVKDYEKTRKAIRLRLEKSLGQEDLEIYDELKSGKKPQELAKKYHKNPTTIYNVNKRVKITKMVLSML